MLLKNMIPFVRFARHRVISPISSDAFRCVQTRDNRLFFVTNGVGKINVEGERYPLERATVALIPAGCKYSLNPDSSMKLIIINFDYTDNFSLIIVSIIGLRSRSVSILTSARQCRSEKPFSTAMQMERP